VIKTLLSWKGSPDKDLDWRGKEVSMALKKAVLFIPLKRGLWKRYGWGSLIVLILLGTTSCLDRISLDSSSAHSGENQSLLDQGKSALSKGDYNTAISIFTQISQTASTPELLCASTYGLALGHSLYWVNQLNQTILRLIIAAQELNPQDVDFGETLRSYLGPLELPLRKLADLAQNAVDKRCEFTLEEGLPIQLGEEGKDLYFFVRIGYHFNEPVARTLVAFSNALLSSFDLLFSHSFVLSQFSDAVTWITGAYNKIQEPVRDSFGNVSQYTYITLARSLGVLFPFNPDLLLFHRDPKEAQRFNRVDNELLSVFRALYERGGQGEKGIIPSLLESSRKVTDLTQEVLGVSDENHDGALNAGDRIFLGIRAIRVGHELSLPDNRGGINMIIPRSIGDLDEIVRNFHDLIQKLGDQMAAVDGGGEPPRIGLTELNGIIRSVDLLNACLDPLPEAVEFDPRSFFLNNPQPLRRYLPYFVPSAGAFTPYEFLIEGESSRPVPDPYVFYRDPSSATLDFPHFPPSILFPDKNEAVNGLTISPDRLFPGEKISQPLPYIAWQDPTFHSVLYVNPALLPVPSPDARESQNDFVLSTSYLTNKALVSYLLWLVDHLYCGP
jgi:hypothetical protein